MSEHADLLPRYKRLRAAGVELNTRLVKSLSRSAIGESGRKLGLLFGNDLTMDTHDVLDVVMDYAIHDVRRFGINAIENYLNTTPPPEGSDDWVLLHALRVSRFSVFVVEGAEAGVGVHVRDLLRDDALFIVDVGFGSSVGAGMVVATRVMVAEGIGMTTGASLPLGTMSKPQRTRLVKDIRETFAGMDFGNLSPEEASDFAGSVLRTCLEDGAATRISYRAPRAAPKRARGRKKRSE